MFLKDITTTTSLWIGAIRLLKHTVHFHIGIGLTCIRLIITAGITRPITFIDGKYL